MTMPAAEIEKRTEKYTRYREGSLFCPLTFAHSLPFAISSPDISPLPGILPTVQGPVQTLPSPKGLALTIQERGSISLLRTPSKFRYKFIW